MLIDIDKPKLQVRRDAAAAGIAYDSLSTVHEQYKTIMVQCTYNYLYDFEYNNCVIGPFKPNTPNIINLRATCRNTV